MVLAGLWFVWFASIPATLKERSIPFNEQAIARIVDETGAKTIVGYAFTNYSELMPSVRDRVAIYDDQNMSFPWFGNRRPDAAAPILFMSQNMELTADVFRQLLSRINTTLPSETRWNFCFDEGAFRFRREQRSQVSYEAVANPDSTRNNMFFYVFDPMRASRQC